LSGGTTKRSSFDSTENQGTTKTKEIGSNALYHHFKITQQGKKKELSNPPIASIHSYLINLPIELIHSQMVPFYFLAEPVVGNPQ